MKLLAPAALCLALVPAAFAQDLETKGSIEAVTVYRGQALVTRLVDVPPAKAIADAAGTLREVIITDLPPKIRPESLHAESSDDVKVRSVRFRQRPVVQDTREEVRKIDARIEAIADRQAANHKKGELINEHRALLTSLQQFVAPTANVELTKGVLNADTLQKLATFIKDQRDKLADEELTLAREARTLQSDLDQAQRERQQLTAGSARTVFEAVVLVTKQGANNGSLRLRYLVDDATWSPSYNIRTAAQPERNVSQASQGQVTLEYYASIYQMSGEDWGNVTMSLSTATPSLVAMAPTLTPMTISLASPVPVQGKTNLAYAEARRDLYNKQRQVEEQRAQNRPSGGVAKAGGEAESWQLEPDLDKSLNEFANSIQVLDLVAEQKVVREAAATSRRASEEGLAVTYTIPTKSTMPSRADRQMIQIAAIPLAADFAKIATPVLTGYVYDQAHAVNNSTMVLLAGPVTAYADGAFVGSGDLPTVAVGESFTAGFGIDSSLRASRELMDRTESIQGGNRVVELTYRLTVENFNGAPASVRLLDRLPKVKSVGGSDIRVTLVSSGPDLSQAEDFVKAQKKDGILRWDLTVPPQSIGPAAMSLEYKFRLEYDKQMTLAGMGG
jgi:hypothetical protein